MAKKKTNWDRIKDQAPGDSQKFHDVYEEQQLEHSKMEPLQTMTSRIVLMAVCAILAAVLAYFAWGLGRYGIHQMTTNMDSAIADVVAGDSSTSDETLTYNPNAPYNYVGTVDDWGHDANGNPEMRTKYTALDENGKKFGPVYDDIESVPEPEWYAMSKAQYESALEDPATQAKVEELEAQDSVWYWLAPNMSNISNFIVAFLTGLAVFGLMYPFMQRNLAAQNLMNDPTDINQYQNDQHVALPEEVMRKFDWFPDAGAHSSVQVSSMISHVALANKGIKKVQMAKRADKDILDEDGDIAYLKGEVLYDADENPILDTVPMFDKKFMESLFDASGLPKETKMRKYYDTTKIPYNPGNADRDKMKGYDTVADAINGDWEIPVYETQRPAGAYLVDVAPVNTMCLAITRAGKGNLARYIA